MECYPNPVVDKATIHFNLDEEGLVCLELYNTLGIRLETIASQRFPEGTRLIEWNADGLAPGIYLIRLTDGKKLAVQKIVKL